MLDVAISRVGDTLHLELGGIRVPLVATGPGQFRLRGYSAPIIAFSDTANDAMSEALIRSHSERHNLSQELDRVSAELETVKSRLSRYQSREIRAAGDPSPQP